MAQIVTKDIPCELAVGNITTIIHIMNILFGLAHIYLENCSNDNAKHLGNCVLLYTSYKDLNKKYLYYLVLMKFKIIFQNYKIKNL